MSPPLVWNRPEWSRGTIVPELPTLRAKYGAQIAEVAERYADLRRDLDEQPSSEARRHTMQRIIDKPESAQMDKLDTQTEAAITRWAWELFHCTDLASLTPKQRAVCARAAEEGIAIPAGGRPNKHELAVSMLQEVLVLADPQLNKAKRLELVEDVLRETKLASSEPDTLRKLRRDLKKLGEVF